MPPPQPNLISRPRLTDRLNEEINHKLVLISAPAGFGKTTLLSDWIHHSEVPVAWLSFDENDNDPVLFLSYVIAALQTIASEVGLAAISLLQSPKPPPFEVVLTSLINDLTEIPTDFALILDDYHLANMQQIHGMIEIYWSTCPSGCIS